MIRAIEIRGFRSLRHVRLELGRLNVLIGPNQSGKTNVLDALSFLANAASGRLHESVFKQRGGFSNLLWMGEGPREIQFRVELGIRLIMAPPPAGTPAALPIPAVYRFTLEEAGGGYVVTEEALHIKERPIFERDSSTCIVHPEAVHPQPKDPFKLALSGDQQQGLFLPTLRHSPLGGITPLGYYDVTDIAVYPGFDVRTRWASTDPRDTAPMRQPQFVENASLLSPLGDNLVNVLYALSQGAGAAYGPANGGPRRDRWREFKDALRVGFPDFEDLVFPADAGMGRISFAWLDRRFPGRRIPADVLSDGTLCFLALTAAVMSPGVPALTAIDEPEKHLHPELLYRLVGVLEQASAGRQILVTTHSDALLSFLTDPSSVILVDNGAEGTTLTRPDRSALDEWLKEYTLGELREAGHLQAFVGAGGESEPSQVIASDGGKQ
ncbi:MAG: AAA family ATPase [Polyangiaceae bacterium]|jgi:predicted ATPase|nr:AAA family ATPase [Polyangiaceae bacterium]